MLGKMRPRELIKAWVEAFNRRDVEQLAAFYREDATNYQVPEFPVTGRDAIQAMFKDAFALAEMVCLPENIFEDGEWGILEWRDPLGLRGCGFFHIVDGQILLQRGYWDKLTFLKLYHLSLPEKQN
jgi:limonene-1,2-epoxide hydrolase